jgi:UDP-N-acetylenolpyruvoylglucosamine reductase
MGTLTSAPPAPDLEPGAPLAPLTTIRVGGPADWLCRASSFRSVVAALAWAEERGLPVAVVGRGSNLVVADEGFRGVVLRLTGRLTSISVRGTDLWCGGGASLPRAVQRAAAHGLEGLEFGASIPGTAGGAVAMNAGAHAGELAQVLRWAVVCGPEGRRRVGLEDLALGYRRSAVRPGEVVAAVGFALRPGDPEAIAARLAEFRAHRRATQPRGVRTFGSVFTNPPGDSAGRLIDAAGLKGRRVGGAEVSPLHANFIVNRDHATAGDVYTLMRAMQDAVYAQAGVWLAPEVQLVGRWPGEALAALAAPPAAGGRGPGAVGEARPVLPDPELPRTDLFGGSGTPRGDA